MKLNNNKNILNIIKKNKNKSAVYLQGLIFEKLGLYPSISTVRLFLNEQKKREA